MATNTAQIFSLPAGLRAGKITTTTNYVIINTTSRRVTTRCPHCQTASRRLHQRTERLVKHGQLDDKVTVLNLLVRRWRCRICCRTFTERFAGISRRQSTAHFRQHVRQEMAEQSLRTCARHNHLSPMTVERELDAVEYEIDWEAQGEAFSLGIDEHSYRRRWMVTTVTNLTRRSLVTILLDDSKAAVKNFLRQIPAFALNRLKEICIDMRSSFRHAIEEELPGVKIVVDPFHVVKLAGTTMEEVRRVVLSDLGRQVRVKKLLRQPAENLTAVERQKLTNLWQATTAWPSLQIAWQTKEKVRDLYHSRNRQSAEKKFRLILTYLEGVDSHYLKQLRRTLVRWQGYILNHFDHDTTNAFTEGIHTKIKMTKRMSYGFGSVERYIKKMLLACVPASSFKISR